MGTGDPTDSNIQLAEKVYPEISREALADRFGCLGGAIIRCVIVSVALAVPAKIALAILGDSLSWGREILAILVFCAVSSFLFTVAAGLLKPDTGVASGESESRDLAYHLLRQAQLRGLSPSSRMVFIYAGAYDEMRQFLVHHRPFRHTRRSLRTILRGHYDLAKGNVGARDLASAGLITFDGDSVTLTDKGAAVFADAWKSLLEQRDSSAKSRYNPSRRFT